MVEKKLSSEEIFSGKVIRLTKDTVELENGNTIVVVQGNDEYFVTGDRVRVLMTGESKVRVQHR